MRIFNVTLNGDDAKEFCKQSTEFKIKWIKTYTNQKNTEAIMEWINNPPKDADCGCGCGGKKAVKEEKKLEPEMPIYKAPSSEEEDGTDMDLNKLPEQDEKQTNFTKRERFRRNN